MKQSHGLEELCCSTPNVLPIRQAASGVNQQYINQKHRILQSGVGEKKMVCGTFSGQTFHLLPRVVSS